MQLIRPLAVISVVVVMIPHWHWIKDQIIHCAIGELISRLWHAAKHVSSTILRPFDWPASMPSFVLGDFISEETIAVFKGIAALSILAAGIWIIDRVGAPRRLT